jgi:hypothetical protein
MSAADGSAGAWRKSSACLPSDCVEVASVGGQVLVRDSADAAGARMLVLSRDQWSAFTRHIARRVVPHGERELPLRSVC